MLNTQFNIDKKGNLSIHISSKYLIDLDIRYESFSIHKMSYLIMYIPFPWDNFVFSKLWM